MEFKLNKVDPELRRRVKETTSTGKIHNKRRISIDKHKNKDKKGHEGRNFSSQLEKYKNGKKKILVDAKKVENIEVKAFKEDDNISSKCCGRGNILDVKK